jgi:hypothetical protein
VQGDQIGRFFASWVIIYFGQFYEKYTSSLNVCVAYFQVKSCVLVLGKNWGGLHYGNLVTLSPCM